MNLLHLKYAIEVQKTGSITKAAQNLYMGQPNLSKALKELESEIGITIFKRTAKGVEPTRKGAEFLSYASTILAQISELETLYKPHPADSLELSFNIPRATYSSVAAAEFVKTYSQKQHLNIRVKETGAIGTINDVSSGESDWGVIRYQNIFEDYFLGLLKDKNLAYETIWEFSLLLMMSDNHPLSSVQTITYDELRQYTEIVHGDFQVPTLSSIQIQKTVELPIPPKRIAIYDRGSQYDMLKRVPGAFMWVSPVPEDVLCENHFILKEYAPSEIINKDLIVYPNTRPLSEHGQKFVSVLKHYTTCAPFITY